MLDTAPEILSREGHHLFLRFDVSRCESAEPAAVFDFLLVRPSRSTLDAADAARLPVFLPAMFHLQCCIEAVNICDHSIQLGSIDLMAQRFASA